MDLVWVWVVLASIGAGAAIINIYNSGSDWWRARTIGNGRRWLARSRTTRDLIRLAIQALYIKIGIEALHGQTEWAAFQLVISVGLVTLLTIHDAWERWHMYKDVDRRTSRDRIEDKAFGDERRKLEVEHAEEEEKET